MPGPSLRWGRPSATVAVELALKKKEDVVRIEMLEGSAAGERAHRIEKEASLDRSFSFFLNFSFSPTVELSCGLSGNCIQQSTDIVTVTAPLDVGKHQF